MVDASLTARELVALERACRRDLQDLQAARASCPSLREVADHDEREIRRALAHVESLLLRNVRQPVADRLIEGAYT